jgi:Family of unknown function (DUF6114)
VLLTVTRWQRFRQWRRARPFWAGVFLIGSGVVILAPPFAALRLGYLVISLSTLGGAASLIIGVMLIVIGISIWVRPQFRLPASIVAGLLALVSLPAANLGGLTLSTPVGSKSWLGGPIVMYVEKLCGTLSVGPLGIGFGVTGYIAGLSIAPLDLPDFLLSAA